MRNESAPFNYMNRQSRSLRQYACLVIPDSDRWIKEQDAPLRAKSTFRGTNTPDHPRHPPVELKLRTLHRCFELGEDVKSVSDEIGYSRAGIYTRRRKYLQKGAVSLMNPADDPRGKLVSGTPTASEEISELKDRIADLQMQVDILAETLNVLKKDLGAATLRNREKAAIVGALRNRYPLPNLLKALHYARSSLGLLLNSLKCIFGVFSARSALQILEIALLFLRIFRLI